MDVTHNDAIGVIGGLLHLAVEATTTSRPAAPVAGQSWIIASGTIGVWPGQVSLSAAGSTEVLPRDDSLVWVKEAAVFAIFQNGS